MTRQEAPFTGSRADLLDSELARQAERPGYWVADHCYVFDGDAVERQLLPAAQQLWDMCLDFVADAVNNENMLASLGLPERVWDNIHASWKRRDPLTVARFDLAYDGKGPPKLHECNADVVGHVYEAGWFQVRWFQAQQQHFPGHAGQLDGLQAALSRQLASASHGRSVELLHVGGDSYDRLMLHAIEQTLSILARPYHFSRLADLASLDTLDPEAGRNSRLFMKDFRWDHLVFEPSRIDLLGKLAGHTSSPLWSVILESKGSLAWLWSRHPGHPNLLPAWLKPKQAHPGRSWVEKPLFSMRGKGVRLRERDAHLAYGAENAAIMYQQLHLLPLFDTKDGSCWASTGVFIVGDRPVTLSMTESDGPLIAEGTDRTVPHVLL